MRACLVLLFVALPGCGLMQPSQRTVLVESNPAGVEIWSRPVRFVYGSTVERHSLKVFGTTPFQLPVIGQGPLELWAVKDGKVMVVHCDAAQEHPVQIDFSKAVPLTRDQELCLRGKVYVGMPAEFARISWGDPKRINSTITRGGKREQWVFGSGDYLYIDADNKVSAIQN